LVLNQDEYDLPSDIYANHMVTTVERNESTDSVESYYPLKRIDPSERSRIWGYFVREGKLILDRDSNKSVTSGLRLQYVKKIPRIDIRRGVITSLTPLTITSVPTGTDFALTDYLSIVDKDGDQKVTNIYITGYNSGTGVISTTATLTGASIGDYVVYGANATTHSELPELFEKYLMEYCAMRIFHRESSSDTNFASQLIQKIETDLVDLYSEDHQDTKEVVVTDYSNLVY
jgi:hypothetical protein